MIPMGIILVLSSLALGAYIYTGTHFTNKKLQKIIERKESEIKHLRITLQHLRESQCKCKKQEQL